MKYFSELLLFLTSCVVIYMITGGLANIMTKSSDAIQSLMVWCILLLIVISGKLILILIKLVNR